MAADDRRMLPKAAEGPTWPPMAAESAKHRRATQTSDVVIFHDVGPGDLPRDLFILNRFFTVPGPAEGPRRRKSAKNLPS